MKKSQAAMEFLLTYGWAIMVVLIVITALAYFGVLDPTKFFTPNQCHLPTGLSCLDHRVYVYNPGFGDYNGLEINLKNNVGNLIHIDYIEIVQFNNKHSDQFIPNLANGEKTKSPNNLQVYDLRNGLPLMKSGEKYSFDFTLTYTNTESKLQHTVNGQVSGKVN